MNVFGNSFDFDGVSSNSYDVMLCSMSSIDNVRSNGITYKISQGNITSERPLPNFYAKSYNDVLEFQIEICRKCNVNMPFSVDEQKEIIRWMTSPYDYREFKIYDREDNGYHSGITYYCICISYGETVIGNNIRAMTFKFKCNAPYGFYDEQIVDFSSTSDSATSFVVDNISDEIEEDYYPIIELEASSTGNVTIVNTLYPAEIMELKVKNGQELIIDNQESDISDNFEMFNYSTDTNLCWIRLAAGENIINVTGDVSGRFKSLYPRKAGI